MAPNPPGTAADRSDSFLSPVAYDDDASSLHSRSDQDTDSEDDEILAAARNSRELRARDRMVLMDEDEVDKLVADSRARERRRSSAHRRGSNLALPNPISLFRRPGSPRRPDTARSESAISDDDLHHSADPKRSQRRDRRRARRDRLMKEAQHGEDGALMYEMEGGRMVDGSSTGDSSDREDSDELDRRRLIQVSGDEKDKRKAWRRKAYIAVTAAVGLAFLSLLAWKLLKGRSSQSARISTELVSNGTALFAPTTLIISLDGFRADFLDWGLTPRLSAFVKEGVSPLYMTPSFPSVTFPNHYTIATGLYPEAHGVVGNTFWDPALEAEFYYTDPEKSLDPKWWGGEPFWVTAEKQGLRSAIHMWPGSEAHILGTEPSFLDKFNGKEKLHKKTARILEFLDKPGFEDPNANVEDTRPQVIAAYVPNVDASGHKNGPNSTETKAAISAVDTMLDGIFTGLETRNLTDIVNVIIVSDHGMATTDVSRMLQVDDLIDIEKVDHLDGWPLVGVRPKDPKDVPLLHAQALENTKDNPNVEIYLKDKDMPERYHFSNNDRIAPLWIVPKTGWAIVPKSEFDIQDARANKKQYHPRGLHGYDHEHPLMRAIFIARGPAFPHQPHSKVEAFQNINVYNILCDSVGMDAVPNNGTLRLPFKTIGLHDSGPASVEETPSESSNTAASPSAASTPQASDPSAPLGVDPVDHVQDRPSPSKGEKHESKDKWWSKIKDGFKWVETKVSELADKMKNIATSKTGSNVKDDSQ